jgi:hypothetical protein
MAILRAPKRWKSEEAVYVLYGGWGKQSIQVLRLLSMLSDLCLVVRCRDEGGF